MKHHLLWVSDLHHTGYGTMARQFLKSLNGKFDLSVLAINHKNKNLKQELQEALPFLINIWVTEIPSQSDGLSLGCKKYTKRPCVKQILGVYKLIEISKYFQPSIILFMNDNIIDNYVSIKWLFPTSKFISYMPVDSGDVPKGYFNYLDNFDLTLAMSQYSQKEIEQSFNKEYVNVKTLYPILNTTDYYQLNNKIDLRAKWIPEYENRYIILNINNNQVRKRLDKTLEMFSIFYRNHTDSYLIIKTGKSDTSGNGINDIYEFINDKYLDIKDNIRVINDILSCQELNELYNIADVFVTTCIGEGWGHTPCEAILAGTNTLVPRHTSFIEIFEGKSPCYNVIETPWYMKNIKESPIPTPEGLYNLISLIRKTTQNRMVKFAKYIEPNNFPTIVISEFGTDIWPQNESMLNSNIKLIANFRTLSYAKTILNDYLTTTKLNAIQIRIQYGKNFTFIRKELGDLNLNKSIIENSEFDVVQVKISVLANFLVSVYLPDIDDMLKHLEELYNTKKEPSSEIKQWLLNNCNSKELGLRLGKYMLSL